MGERLCLLRGGGDLATGVAWRLSRAGVPIVVLEIEEPLTVRRTVALSSAVTEKIVDIEGMVGRLVADPAEAADVAASGDIAVLVSPDLPDLGRSIVVDARMAKSCLDTTIHDADLVVGLGPGFIATVDCHAVVETQRGHRLGRVLWSGGAAPDTGTPGIVVGKGAERVLRAPANGIVRWQVAIGEAVVSGQILGAVDDEVVLAPFGGMIRGLILEGRPVSAGIKIGDVDPRLDAGACYEISDKALAVGGGVLEAIHVAGRASL